MNEQRAPLWEEFTAVALLALLWLAATAWARPLMLPDEGRYAGVAWEMLRSGDWLTPTLNGLPFFHKPPLFYWISAAAMAVFGTHEAAARAPSVLGAAAAALALYAFVRHWRDARSARLALVVLLAQPLWFLGGQFANLDMLVAACISVTILLFAHAALSRDQGRPYRSALAWGYVAAALGVLAKGLIGAVLPALVLVLWLAALRRWRTLLAMLWLPGLLLFLLIATPWFVAMQWQHSDFLDYFFVVQHFKRFAAGGFNNVMPFWFYPAVLAVAALPWWPWLGPAFRRHAALPAPRTQVDIRLLMALWLASVVVFFSLPASKLVGYVLPAVPPLAYLIADAFLARAQPASRAKRLWWASAGVAAALSLGTVLALTLHPSQSSQPLALALAAHRAPHEPVFMLGRYEYDIPFYAHLRHPVVVVDHWDNPEIALHDNWRKELADAGRFAPERAARTLLTPARLNKALCAVPVAWVVGPADTAGNYAFLGKAREVAAHATTRLWKVDQTFPGVLEALGCEGQGRLEQAP